MADWDRILSSAPLNRTAAVGTGGSDEPAGFRKEIVDPYLQDGPHPTRKPQAHPEFRDLTGKRFGRFAVLGLSNMKSTASGGSMWSVRCDCSRYTLRRIRSLENGGAQMCAECDHAERVKRGEGLINLADRGDEPC